jgi:aspartate 1-decarboxylase
MLVTLMKSKLHRAKLTQTELTYEGSISIDPVLMEEANMLEHERVQVLNCSNGERLETYIIKGKRGSREFCLNGPAARKGYVGDEIIIISYATMELKDARVYKPVVVCLDENNEIINEHSF